jgi:hypothetical protein
MVTRWRLLGRPTLRRKVRDVGWGNRSEEYAVKNEMKGKSKYIGLGLALGAALGTVFGVMAGHVGVWLAVGVAVGLAIGVSFRRKPAVCPECAAVHRAHEVRKQA